MTARFIPTYTLRIERHADSADLWYVSTITAHGLRHLFGHDIEEGFAWALHADLSKLNRGTIAWLAGDLGQARHRRRNQPCTNLPRDAGRKLVSPRRDVGHYRGFRQRPHQHERRRHR